MVAKAQFITDLLKSLKVKYQELLDDAIEFYQEYETLYGVYAKEKRRIREIEHQLTTIQNYKEKHGIYPQIKDQPDAEAYLKELDKLKLRAETDLRKVEPEVVKGFDRRSTMLTSISRKIAVMMMEDKDASQFITTMMLRAPLPNDHTRCPTNEKNKPLYIAALSACLVKRLIKNSGLEAALGSDYITSRFPTKVEIENGVKEYNQEQTEVYINEVLTPIITASLIHNIGSYSPDAEAIYQGNRYQVLEEEERKVLIKAIHDNTDNYLKYGIGKPSHADFEEPELYQKAVDKYQLIAAILDGYSQSLDPHGNLLRVPMIYSSFMMSTKQKHDFRVSFKAFEILKGGVEKGVVHKEFGEEFLRMVGRYPLGTGIFFISRETKMPERAVVTGLNPPKTSSAIVKQLTRRQVKFDDHTQVCASKGYIISNEEARRDSDFGTEYYKKQFAKGFFWNPAEPWERDIDHQKFWRRDNNIKSN